MDKLRRLLLERERAPKLAAAREAGEKLKSLQAGLKSLHRQLNKLFKQKEDLSSTFFKLMIISQAPFTPSDSILQSEGFRDYILTRENGDLRNNYFSLFSILNQIIDLKITIMKTEQAVEKAAQESRRLTGIARWNR